MKLSIFLAAITAVLGLMVTAPSSEAGGGVSRAFKECFYDLRMFVPDGQAKRRCARRHGMLEGGRGGYGRPAVRNRGVPCGGTCGNRGYRDGRGSQSRAGRSVSIEKWHRRITKRRLQHRGILLVPRGGGEPIFIPD